MTLSEQKRALACAVKAAKTAGGVMRKNLFADKKITASWQHDIKLELDVRCQKLIEKMLHADFPQVALLGELAESDKDSPAEVEAHAVSAPRAARSLLDIFTRRRGSR